jgi:exopolyphosphatase / guanosine-5'-triphosphate,3'-diphosphate pyrophosphatase
LLNTIAIIDLGTNTFNLLIANYVGNSYETIFQTKRIVKLGEGGIEKKIITQAAIHRALEVLQEYKQIIVENNVSKTICIGTSAIRNANNSDIFCDTVYDTLQFKIEIIDGNAEAEYIYKGVKQAVMLSEKNSLIVDIGGGSVEFIIANKNKIAWKKSYEIGASRILEKHKPQDPITAEKSVEIEQYYKNELQQLFEAFNTYSCIELIGSSGSFDTLAEVISIKQNENIQLEKEKTYTFDIATYFEVHHFLLHSTYMQRLATPGIISIRAEMIVVASILINLLLQTLNITKMRMSTFSLKEGVMSHLLNTKINTND